MTRRAERLYRDLKNVFPIAHKDIIPVLNRHGILCREKAPRGKRIKKEGPIQVGFYHRQNPGYFTLGPGFTPEPLKESNLIQVTRAMNGNYYYQYENTKKDTYGQYPNPLTPDIFERWQKNEAWVYLGTENPLEKRLTPTHLGVKLGWYARRGRRDSWNLLNVTNQGDRFAYTQKGVNPIYFASAEDMLGYISGENWEYLGTEEPAVITPAIATPVKEKKWNC